MIAQLLCSLCDYVAMAFMCGVAGGLAGYAIFWIFFK